MFTSPTYAQPECNASTVLFFFGAPLQASQIDPHLRTSGSPTDPSYFVIWPLWLLFSMSLTMAYFIILSVSSSSSLLPKAASHLVTPRPTGFAYNTPRSRGQSRVRDFLPRSRSPSRKRSRTPAPSARRFRFPSRRELASLLPSREALVLFSHNFWAVVLSGGLVIATETQHALQPWLLPGENDATGFGQMAALLLASAPLWSIGMAWFRGCPEAELELPIAHTQSWHVSFPSPPPGSRRSPSPRDRGRSGKVVVLSPQTTPEAMSHLRLRSRTGDSEEWEPEERHWLSRGTDTSSEEDVSTPRSQGWRAYDDPRGGEGESGLLLLVNAREEEGGEKAVQVRYQAYEVQEDEKQEIREELPGDRDSAADRPPSPPPSLPVVAMAGPLAIDFLWLGRNAEDEVQREEEEAIPLQELHRD